jgi:hypothetical protein
MGSGHVIGPSVSYPIRATKGLRKGENIFLGTRSFWKRSDKNGFTIPYLGQEIMGVV